MGGQRDQDEWFGNEEDDEQEFIQPKINSYYNRQQDVNEFY